MKYDRQSPQLVWISISSVGDATLVVSSSSKSSPSVENHHETSPLFTRWACVGPPAKKKADANKGITYLWAVALGDLLGLWLESPHVPNPQLIWGHQPGTGGYYTKIGRYEVHRWISSVYVARLAPWLWYFALAHAIPVIAENPAASQCSFMLGQESHCWGRRVLDSSRPFLWRRFWLVDCWSSHANQRFYDPDWIRQSLILLGELSEHIDCKSPTFTLHRVLTNIITSRSRQLVDSTSFYCWIIGSYSGRQRLLSCLPMQQRAQCRHSSLGFSGQPLLTRDKWATR